MWSFLRRRLLWFLIGFVIAFLVYLFIRYNVDQIVLGMVIAAGGGLGLTVVIFYLERRFPDKKDLPAAPEVKNQRT
jgi:cell division protein FtsW (lipid II flippase)